MHKHTVVKDHNEGVAIEPEIIPSVVTVSLCFVPLSKVVMQAVRRMHSR